MIYCCFLYKKIIKVDTGITTLVSVQYLSYSYNCTQLDRYL